MTEKDCGHHEDAKKKLIRRILAGVGALIILILFTILLVWLILRPTKPRFILQDITVYAFNISAPNLFTSNIQITLSSRNPNGRVGAYYDKLHIYASYRGQQITWPTLLPTTYQGHKDVTIWSPFLYGNSVPVAPFITQSLSQEQMAGNVMLNVKVDGRVRWKVGSFISNRYHLNVDCPAYINFGKQNAIMVGPAIKYQLLLRCQVDV